MVEKLLYSLANVHRWVLFEICGRSSSPVLPRPPPRRTLSINPDGRRAGFIMFGKRRTLGAFFVSNSNSFFELELSRACFQGSKGCPPIGSKVDGRIRKIEQLCGRSSCSKMLNNLRLLREHLVLDSSSPQQRRVGSSAAELLIGYAELCAEFERGSSSRQQSCRSARCAEFKKDSSNSKEDPGSALKSRSTAVRRL